jgi:peptide maturation system protein (TIGR04066 family)
MMKKQRLMVYPFDNEFLPAVKYPEFMPDYEITELVSLKGWGLAGKDAGVAGKSSNTGFAVSENFEEALLKCNAVLFVDSNPKPDFNKIIYPKILDAINNSKNILCSVSIDAKTKRQLSELASKKGISCTFLKDSKNFIPPERSDIYNMSTPVIFVFGIAERTNKFAIQLALRKRLLEEGYKVTQIGTRDYCEFLGFHSMPDFMYDKSLSEAEKITLFNHYVKNLEVTEKPDIIVIGLPGGIMKFNNQYTNRFGITAYEISQAIIPDAAVCSVLYEDYEVSFFENVYTSVKYKLGFNIDCFNVSNYRFDWVRSDTTSQMAYTLLEAAAVTEKAENWSALGTMAYNILNDGHADKMYELIMDKLSDYAEIPAF